MRSRCLTCQAVTVPSRAERVSLEGKRSRPRSRASADSPARVRSMWLIRAIPVRKRVTNVISLSSGVKWALGAEGTVTVWSRWGSSRLRRYWRMTGKKPQRERVEAEYSTVMVGRCSGYDRGQDIVPSVMISAVRWCDTSIIRGRCSPLQPHLLLRLTNRHLRNACVSWIEVFEVHA